MTHDAGGNRRRRKSWNNFLYALEGWKFAWTHEPHMKFHSIAAIVVIVAALLLKVSRLELLFLLLTCTLVIVCELINTAIEKTVDLAQPNIHPMAKIAKDAAAGAVLISAVFAIVVGLLIFVPAIWKWIERVY